MSLEDLKHEFSNGKTWVRIYIPTGLIVGAMVAGGLYALRVRNAAQENTRAIEALERELDARVGYFNWFGEALETIAEHQDIRLPPRPIIQEDD